MSIEPAGARVADAQASLDERDGRGLRLDDDLDRLLEQRILVRIEVLVAGLVAPSVALGSLEERLVELLRALGAALLDDERDLLLADVRALDALEPRRAERLEQHVALARGAPRRRPGRG